MTNKLKVKPSSRAAALSQRGAPMTLDEAARSVEFTAATEQPVMVMDWERWDIVPEVLRVDGVVLPESGQVPLLNTHSRDRVGDMLGSFRDFRVEGGQLVGRAFFANTPDSEQAFALVRDGHLTDVSVGYEVLASTWVEDGATVMVEGVEYTGPVRVTTNWRLFEVSLCPIGADDKAKARAATINTGEGSMSKAVRFDAETVQEQVEKTVEALDDLKAALEEEDQNEAKEAEESGDTPEEGRELPAEEGGELPEEEEEQSEEGAEGARAAVEGGIQAERSRIVNITAMCRAHNVPAALQDKLIKEGVSMNKAREAVLSHVENRQSANFARYEMGKSEQEKIREAVGHGLLLRCGIAQGRINDGKVAAGAENFRGYTLREVCRELLMRSGQRVDGNAHQLVSRALATTDLPVLLTETANRLLLDGWESANHQWKEWCHTRSVSDFKPTSLVDFAISQDLPEVKEGAEYTYGTAAESVETATLATYGKILNLSRQAIINDDLGAFADIARYHGEACARKANQLACNVLTANAAMKDGVALFHASHKNLLTGGGAPTVATLGAASAAMKLQKDAAGNAISVRPAFFIAPVALEAAAESFFRSDYVGTQAEPLKANVFGGNVLTRIYDANLDTVSATDWYLAAPKGKAVTVFTLEGAEAPYLETREGWESDGMEYKVRFDLAAAATSWRGLCKSVKSA